MTVKPYIMVDYDLLKADGFFNKNHDAKSIATHSTTPTLTPNDKIVYSYIRARLKFFVDEKKGEYYDTQESIAEALAMNISSSRKSLNKFIDCGILIASKEKFRNYSNYRYKSILELDLWEYGDAKETIPIVPVYFERKSSGREKPPAHVYQPTPSWDYDDQEPF